MASAAKRVSLPGTKAKRAARADGETAQRRQPLEHRILLTATLCLLAFGAVMVYSASSATSLLQGQGTGSGYLVKYVMYGAIGLVLMRLLARDGVAKVQSITAPLLVASFVLVLAVHVPHVGVSVNGARRWIGPGPFQFQPSELMKLALVLYAATLLAKRPQRVNDLRELANPLLVVVGGAILLVVTQPDLGTAMVIAFTTIALLVAAGIPLRNLAIVCGAAFAAVVLYALVKPYTRARLTSFIDPWAHASGSGFQAVQGQIAIGSGGLLGAGPGQSVQKIFYLPEAPTDFILAVIGEELGVVGVFGLLFLYGLIAYAGLRAAKGARSLYSALIAVGMTSLIVSQAILNVFAVLGLAPLTGVPLPFVSYGSSSLIVMLAAMGMLMNVAAGGTAHVRAVARRANDGLPGGRPGKPLRRAARPRAQPTRTDANRDDGSVSRETKIVIAAGGTAGHVIPALAVAGALRAKGARVTFIGGERAESELVPQAGYELRKISVEGMSRTNPLHAARALWRAARAFARARSLLKDLEPDAVMGGGGYVAGPVGLAAVSLRIPLVLTEADSHLGLTNRLLARAARRVCLAFPLAGREGPRYRVTGRPGPPPQQDRAGARRRLGVGGASECVLVFGGSLGARSINLAAVEAFAGETPVEAPGGTRPGDRVSGDRMSGGTAAAGAGFEVLHVAGRRDYPELSARARRPGYDLREYLNLDEFADALAAADLVVARAGGSVFEIAAHGVPAILVPYPHASADHQSANARWMADAGAAVVIADGELDARRLGEEVVAPLADRVRLAQMASASKALARPDAAKEIAEELLAAAS